MKLPLILSSLAVLLTASACNEQGASVSEAPTSAANDAEAGATGSMTTEMKTDPSNPYMISETNMHEKMMAAKGTDAAETWTRKMIEHHKGALSMSEVALKETDDAEVRRMAQSTIDMQTKEIDELQKMLTDSGKAAQ